MIRFIAPVLPSLRRLPRPDPVGVLGFALLAALALWLTINLVATPAAFTNLTLIGITLGCVYALIALGYTLVYGILELINFAHGDVFMLGTMFTVTYAVRLFGLGPGQGAVTAAKLAGTLVLVMLTCAAINATIEFVAYRRLRAAPKLAPLITALGVSFILQNVALAWKGPNYVNAPDVLPHGPFLAIRDIEVAQDKLIVVVVTLFVLVGLILLVQGTWHGKAMRAVAQDMDTAAMLGIDVNRTISFTFMLAGALAGAAGLLYALYVTTVRYDIGFQLGLVAFTAAVLGGVGNLAGAVLGAILLGLIESFNEGLSWHSPGSDWTGSIVFSVLILILVFRPQGLLGEQVHA